MTGITHFETFLLTGILLNITPGNDTFFILTKSIAQGKQAGIVSTLGIATGSIIHTLLAAFGLSIIIAKSIVLFNLIKYAGALYLLYLGYKTLTGKSEMNIDFTTKNKSVDYLKVYRDAVITNVLNPKVALFFISFLPQFINPALKNTLLPFLTLGLTFITTGTVWCLILTNFAAVIFSQLRDNKKVSTLLNKICGMALIGMGIKLAFTDKK
jgi:RhtB (resistance to homoserine/threonine) family protein